LLHPKETLLVFVHPQKPKLDNPERKPLTCIDLFSGCGGFSLGIERAGLHTLAAIDIDPQAVQTYRKNFPNIPHVLERDITMYAPSDLDILLGGQAVDVIIGGPPCQGFSNVRKVDGANHGNRFVEDPRRYLYREFLKYVAYFKPSVFVIENVLGIRTTAGGDFYTRVNFEARALGYRVHGEEIRAWRYGVPQKRIRQLIIGTKNELPIFVGSRFMPPTHSDSAGEKASQLAPIVTLWEAIGDLAPLRAGSGVQSCEYDMALRKSQIARYSNRYIEGVLEVHRAKSLTAHVARPHNDRDLRDFDRLHEGESSAVAMRDRNVTFEWPYSKEHFKDRYTRQHRDQLCSTIVAHLSKDGLMFIHPTQCRSLTVREAARVQTFPDWFIFPDARTYAFRLIGNAVPPIIGQTVGSGIRAYLEFSRRTKQTKTVVPTSPLEALQNLSILMKASDNSSLRKISIQEFKSGWFSLGFLYTNLHPDGVTENGAIVVDQVRPRCELQLLTELSSNTFARSGWPVKLIPVGKEARRRFLQGQLSYDEYYYSHAQKAGIEFLTKEVIKLDASAAHRA
jgi:DNA (cytosine-5)-methyltransferase 1